MTTDPNPNTTPNRGRPSALTLEDRRRIIALISQGCSRRVAAKYIGCAPSTIGLTANRDLDFANELARAEAHLELKMLNAVHRAVDSDRHWRAAAWLLQQKNPDDYPSTKTQTYSSDQVVQIVLAIFESLYEDLPQHYRDHAAHKLTGLLAQLPPHGPSGKKPTQYDPDTSLHASQPQPDPAS